MFRLARRATFVAASAALALLSMSTLASAHECFNTSWSARANSEIAQHSHGWFDIQTWQLTAIFAGTCDPTTGGCPPLPPGTAAVTTVNPDLLVGAILGFVPDPSAVMSPAQYDAFTALVSFSQDVATVAHEQFGVPTNYLTLANATAAGGADHSGQDVTADGHGIEHFPDVYGAQLMAAYQQVFCGLVTCP